MTRKKPTRENKNGRIIRHAAKVMADRPWTQGAIGTLNTAVCTKGGILFSHMPHTVLQSGPLSQQAMIRSIKQRKQLLDAEMDFGNWLYENGYAMTRSVPTWNDTEGRTKEEVLMYMNKFADEMDPQIA